MTNIKFKTGFPDPKEPGITHGKDIMLICKRWYDREKYPTIKDALEQYYQERYIPGEPKEEPLSFGFINVVLLKPAVQEFLNEKFKSIFIEWLFNKNIRELQDIENVSYEEMLYYKLIGFLGSLYRFDDNDHSTIFINTEGYWVRDEVGKEVRPNGHTMLEKPIIN